MGLAARVMTCRPLPSISFTICERSYSSSSSDILWTIKRKKKIKAAEEGVPTSENQQCCKNRTASSRPWLMLLMRGWVACTRDDAQAAALHLFQDLQDCSSSSSDK
jgi:hypothetical protein